MAVGSKSQRTDNLCELFGGSCQQVLARLPLSYGQPVLQANFSRTRLNPKKATEGEFETTHRGYRFTTSVGGTLTGRGGDILIIDDPIKANDANSVVALEGAIDWYRDTAQSRSMIRERASSL